MARRRKLTAPSPEDLDRLEAEFRRETSASAMAPIAQVAGEAALSAPVVDSSTRSEAAAFRIARAEGRVIVEVPLAEIAPDDMVRDRARLGEEEMEELCRSIVQNGLRLPVELYAREGPGPRYGILSGYRRYKAFECLLDRTGDDRYGRIRALVRKPGSVPAAFAAMVEENEIRADLSHFERGRIASIAAQSGVFDSVEEAVAGLFAQASKAKRSKIRAFAQIFEELGDLLSAPAEMTEKQGLRLAAALRAGAESDLRAALAGLHPERDGAAEWAALEPLVARHEEAGRDPRKGGRPPARPRPAPGFGSAGLSLRHETDARGHLIRIEGEGVDAGTVEALLAELRRLLEGAR